jgi:hypothetical protein
MHKLHKRFTAFPQASFLLIFEKIPLGMTRAENFLRPRFLEAKKALDHSRGFNAWARLVV